MKFFQANKNKVTGCIKYKFFNPLYWTWHDHVSSILKNAEPVLINPQSVANLVMDVPKTLYTVKKEPLNIYKTFLISV